MLLLDRKLGEEVYIGHDIIVSYEFGSKNKIRLGFVAPKDVVILRKEVYDREYRNNENQALNRAGFPIFE